MAYHPDTWSSYLYAAASAGAYHIFEKHVTSMMAPALEDYLRSALDAMNWAENNWASSQAYWVRANSPLPFPSQMVINVRNLAAAKLFRATGGVRWHKVFVETTFFTATVTYAQGYDQADAAWVYYSTDRSNMSEEIKTHCRNIITDAGNLFLYMQPLTGFRLGKNFWVAAGLGNLTGADPLLPNVVRAHMISKNTNLLKGLIISSQSDLGANPLNMTYTTGIGHKYPEHLSHYDSRGLQNPPPGITVEGPYDAFCTPSGDYNYCFAPFVFPGTDMLPTWPAMEAYSDAFWPPNMSEFKVNQAIARNAYIWGYLAALRGFQLTAPHSLTVVRSGSGAGTVNSAPSGIDCGTKCSATFSGMTEVTLSPVFDTGSSFAGWNGSGSGVQIRHNR